MILSFLSLFAFAAAMADPEAANLDYQASCVFAGMMLTPADCLVSLGTVGRNHSLDLDISRDLFLMDELDDYCTLRRDLVSSVSRGSLALARRGACLFTEKVEAAQSLGYEAILILNDDDNLFVIGASEHAHVHIPVFFAGRSLVDRIREIASSEITGSNMMSVQLRFDRAKPQRYSFQDSAATNFAGVVILICILLTPAASRVLGRKAAGVSMGLDGASSISCILHCVLVALLGFALKLGTFRVLSRLSADHYRFNHNEMDERIFQLLVDSVSSDWGNYRLSRDMIHQFQLSEDNYGDTLFIHPPIFVYLSACFQSFGISLAIIPSVFHLVTVGCIILLVQGMDIPLNVNRNTIMTRAVTIFTFCPIAFFCSQKVFGTTN